LATSRMFCLQARMPRFPLINPLATYNPQACPKVPRTHYQDQWILTPISLQFWSVCWFVFSRLILSCLRPLINQLAPCNWTECAKDPKTHYWARWILIPIAL
jgi:hypothetical protein